MLDDGDIEAAYRFCVSRVGDRGYCAKVVELIREAEVRRVFTWGNKPRHYLILPEVEHTVAAAFDRDRNYIFIFMQYAAYIAVLVYKRNGDDFTLSHAGVDTPEVRAMKNGPPSTLRPF
jgi:hypothetical protein